MFPFFSFFNRGSNEGDDIGILYDYLYVIYTFRNILKTKQRNTVYKKKN